VAFEPGADRPTPIEGLDAITGDPALAGWHLAIRPHPGMTSAELVNLQSPFDVVAQVPARPLR
jgi:hypothetical protein